MFLSNSDKEQVSITYANGVTKKCNRILKNFKVKDGSIFQVGFEEPKEKFDATEYAKELTNILANIAQVISILIIAANAN